MTARVWLCEVEREKYIVSVDSKPRIPKIVLWLRNVKENWRVLLWELAYHIPDE